MFKKMKDELAIQNRRGISISDVKCIVSKSACW